MATTAEIPSIDFGVSVFDIAFHPLQDVVAVGLVSGVLEIHTYSSGRTSRALKLKLHEDALRTIVWRPDGQRECIIVGTNKI